MTLYRIFLFQFNKNSYICNGFTELLSFLRMKLKPIAILLLITLATIPLKAQTPVTPNVSSEASRPGYFPLSDADIYTDSKDYHVVGITANMFADDVERVTGKRPHVAVTASVKSIPKGVTVVVGTVGKSRLIDELVRQKAIDVSCQPSKANGNRISSLPSTGPE